MAESRILRWMALGLNGKISSLNLISVPSKYGILGGCNNALTCPRLTSVQPHVSPAGIGRDRHTNAWFPSTSISDHLNRSRPLSDNSRSVGMPSGDTYGHAHHSAHSSIGSDRDSTGIINMAITTYRITLLHESIKDEYPLAWLLLSPSHQFDLVCVPYRLESKNQ